MAIKGLFYMHMARVPQQLVDNYTCRICRERELGFLTRYSPRLWDAICYLKRVVATLRGSSLQERNNTDARVVTNQANYMRVPEREINPAEGRRK
ncbi:hypothetical protein [Flavihumibacter fluvii]|uniref:hypothetical protein n=1 Tax=Flavihumibacter fluvii TaxID=2838157 RepID=UPI001BDE66F9|nr:hypothetical protein [Flavihumibacter fluvii]ULQ54083.1 hypothetical protein KJS93_07090 [Flavihumibacter fluvii]